MTKLIVNCKRTIAIVLFCGKGARGGGGAEHYLLNRKMVLKIT